MYLSSRVERHGERAEGWAAILSPRRIVKRGSSMTTGTIVFIGIAAGLVVFGIILAYLSRNGYLKRFFGSKKGRYQSASGGETDSTSHQLNPATAATPNRNTNRNTTERSAAVDRHTSVRSIMTLPPYSYTASNNEQVLGREGDRDGIDVIVDLPGEEDEETRRDQEMETMYQIRLARRQANAERAERTRLRQEARDRQDWETLESIRTQARLASQDNTVSNLRQEVEDLRRNRDRSVSSVSYGDLGVARHDGTRLRANSSETERMGLLSDAASMAASERRSSVQDTRERRASSVSSFGSAAHSRGTTPRPTHDRTASIGSYHDGGLSPDMGDQSMPPPEYDEVSLDDDDSDRRRNSALRSTTPMEEPPDYPGPRRSDTQRTATSTQESEPELSRVSTNAPQLPQLRVEDLPQIIVEPSSARPPDDHP